MYPIRSDLDNSTALVTWLNIQLNNPQQYHKLLNFLNAYCMQMVNVLCIISYCK